jgi:hypothetical protein
MLDDDEQLDVTNWAITSVHQLMQVNVAIACGHFS